MAKESKKIPVLRVTGPKQGFRRAGMSFGPTPTDVVKANLTKEQIAALKSEPMLIVVETEIDAPAESE